MSTLEDVRQIASLENPFGRHPVETHTWVAYPDYRHEHIASLRWWAVPCPHCGAKVDQPCGSARSWRSVTTHEKRKKAYHSRFGYGIPDADKPGWWHALQHRRKQRRTVLALEQAEHNLALARGHLTTLLSRAEDQDIDPSLVDEARRSGRASGRKVAEQNKRLAERASR